MLTNTGIVYKTEHNLIQIRKLVRQYDMIEELNVDSKAECDQLNLAHVARKKNV